MEFVDGLVSIITPVYNAETFIPDMIQSVLAQSFTNWEFLLINDASSDNSLNLLKNFSTKDMRIRIINLEKNSGAAVARNAGLTAAKGQYVAFIDSDDMWSPDKLSQQMEFMEQNHYAFTYTDFATIDTEGTILKAKADVPSQLGYNQLLKNTAIACSTVMIDRSIVGDFKMPLVRKGQDTATWLKIMREQGITAYGLQRVLNYYRQVPGSISSNRLGALKRTWYTYYHLEKLPLPRAIYSFICYIINAVKRRL